MPKLAGQTEAAWMYLMLVCTPRAVMMASRSEGDIVSRDRGRKADLTAVTIASKATVWSGTGVLSSSKRAER